MLVRQVAGAIAVEARAKQNYLYARGQAGWNVGSVCVAPVVNLARVRPRPSTLFNLAWRLGPPLPARILLIARCRPAGLTA